MSWNRSNYCLLLQYDLPQYPAVFALCWSNWSIGQRRSCVCFPFAEGVVFTISSHYFWHITNGASLSAFVCLTSCNHYFGLEFVLVGSCEVFVCPCIFFHFSYWKLSFCQKKEERLLKNSSSLKVVLNINMSILIDFLCRKKLREIPIQERNCCGVVVNVVL